RSLFKGGVYADVRNINKDRFVAASEPVTSKLKEVTRRTGAIVINPVDYLCGKLICPSLAENGEPIYKDKSHIRTSYARDHVFFMDETILKD
ncbi:MAG TPA: SGNH hydrolase domain-containing protein, partial [Burkholderiales bacterium]|nr:SGNH hydrolase domain-containing protein [Burkholderiales bacterium]